MLASPPGSVVVSEAPALHASYAATVRVVAIHLEVLDRREQHLTQSANFAADMKELQGRFQELAGAPFLDECVRFPERMVASDLLAGNRAYQEELKARLILDRIHEDDLRAALEETEELFRIWDAVREARCDYWFVTARRQALQELRDLVGVEAFCSGRLPPPVPVWRLPEY
jgi:hypothetical protein